MHFPGIWRSKFADLANKTVKKTSIFGEKNNCKQKCLDKNLKIVFFMVFINFPGENSI